MQLAFVGRFRCHYDFTLLVKQFKSVAFNFDCHFHIVLLLVDGANLGHSVIKVNIFFQLITFSLILSGFHGAVFPCKNVKNQLELQF